MGGDRGSTAARPTLTRDWGGPQVRDPVPVVSVNPEADQTTPESPHPTRITKGREEKSTRRARRRGGVSERSGEKSSTRSEASTAHGNLSLKRETEHRTAVCCSP